MVDDGHLAVSFLDLQLRGRGLDTEGVVVGSVDHHDGRCFGALPTEVFE